MLPLRSQFAERATLEEQMRQNLVCRPRIRG